MRIIIYIALFLLGSEIWSQIKGEPVPEFNPDTVFTFKSPRPLLSIDPAQRVYSNAWGINLLFSSSGFGLGGFYHQLIGNELYIFASLYISGARNTDEIDTWDDETFSWRVPNKINRLFLIPVSIGIEKYVLTHELSESLKPYLEAGIGPSFIIATPYNKEFFSSFGSANTYTRFGGFVGVGAYFDASSASLLGLNFRYYYIPFGGNGLESIKGLPIHSFGGFFISLSVGLRF